MLDLNTNPATRVLAVLQGISLVGIGLYAVTFAAQWFAVVARYPDAHLTSALNLLLLVPVDTPALHPLRSLPFRGLAWLASGQAVQWFTANAWQTYWRSREFIADQYAVRLGQGPALAQSLEHESLPYERSIPNMRFSRASHPYTKPRIAKLRAQPQPAASR